MHVPMKIDTIPEEFEEETKVGETLKVEEDAPPLDSSESDDEVDIDSSSSSSSSQ